MSSVGQAVGMVVGAAIGFFTGGVGYLAMGAAIGGAIGSAIDPPKGPKIEGPRLDDLSVQTSTYGAPLGRAYGTVAVTGNIFWLEGDQLKETTKTEEQGGKGGGGAESTTYEYTATFAVGLLQVPDANSIVSLRRLWIDTNLVYEAGSDNTDSIIASNQIAGMVEALWFGGIAWGGEGITPTYPAFTFYNGADDQLPNERMQADKGAANVSAYPGLCYIVFNDLNLTEKYSNTLMRAQVKAELVIGGVADPQEIEAVEMFENTTGASTLNFLGSSWFDGQFVYAYYARWAQSNYDCIDVQSVIYDTTTGERTAATAGALPAYTDGIFESKNNCQINQTSLAAVAIIKYRLPNDGTRLYVHSASGDLLCDTDWMPQATLPYEDYTIAIDGGEIFLAHPARKVYKISVSSQVGAVVASTSSSYDIRAIGYSENYVFAAAFDGNSTATIYRFNRADLTLDTTYTKANHGLYNYISMVVVSDDLFYTRSNVVGGHVWKWEYGAATDTGLVFSASGNNFGTDRLYVPGPAMGWYLNYQDGGDNDWHLYQLYVKVPAEAAKLRDVVTAESYLAGIDSTDLDLTSLTNSDVRGYRIAQRGSIRSALEPLQTAYLFDVANSGYKIRFVSRGGASVDTIPTEDLGATDGGPITLLPVSREMDSQIPAKVSVRYLDPAREYDYGEQFVERDMVASVNEWVVDLPLVMVGSEAAQLADILDSKNWTERRDFGPFTIPQTWRKLEAADVITVEHRGKSYELRLTRVEYLPDGRIQCAAKATAGASYTSTATGEDPLTVGQSLVPLAGYTLAYLLDIPRIRSEQDVVGMAFGLLGKSSGWPGGILARSDDSGNTWVNCGAMNSPARVFTAAGTLAAHDGYSVDNASVLVVTPALSSASLSSITEDQLYANGNIAAYGIDGRWEIVAFQTVVDNTGSFTISNFIRGLYGTEQYTGTHIAGDLLIMLDTTTTGFFGLPVAALNSPRLYRAITQGREISSSQDEPDTYTAENLRPPAPVDITGWRDPANLDWYVSAVERTRWPVSLFSGSVVPESETPQNYTIEIWDTAFASLKRTFSGLASPETPYTIAEQTADFGSERSTLYVKARQVSSVVGNGQTASASLYRYLPLDPYGDFVGFILQCEGTNGSTTFLDEKLNTVTAYGNAQITTTDPLSGSGSALLDGAGDYLRIPDSSGLEIASGDFTFEAFIKLTGYSASYGGYYAGIIVGKDAAAARAFHFKVQGTASAWNAMVFSTAGTELTVSATIALNTKYHIAVSKSGTSLRFFLDGVQQGLTQTHNTSIANVTTDWTIGSILYTSYEYYFPGRIDAIRYTKFGRYTANFPPPTSIPNP